MFSTSTIIGIAVLLLCGAGYYVYSMWRKIADVKEEADGKIQCIFHMQNGTDEIELLTAGPNGIDPPSHHLSMEGQKYQVVESAVRPVKFPLYEKKGWAQVTIPQLEFYEGESIPLTIEGNKLTAKMPANMAAFISNNQAMGMLVAILKSYGGAGDKKEKMTLVYVLCGLALLAALVAAYFSYKNGQDGKANIEAMKSMWGY